jgi:poly(A) polymerase
MVEPTIVPRSAHKISRRQVEPDALKVLYRLHEHNYVAYLVGGSVRDLLLERRPKDFDIGTSAHPHQIKKLFRNCWIIGRRFRLAHVKFGTKTIEVATFRRQIDAGTTPEAELAGLNPPEIDAPDERLPPDDDGQVRRRRDHFIHRDNTYGTPEEDAFRRDFTVNALFYDIATFSIIDYVGGLRDLDARLIRCIGDPDVRFLEDPVRMLRAVVLAARLEFTIDEPILESIAALKHEIARSAPARLLEEYFKILRSGHAQNAFAQLRATSLLKEITPELAAAPDSLWRGIAALDSYRSNFGATPDTLTNAVLAGTLLHPLGLVNRPQRFSADPLERRVDLGLLPIPRRDVERLQQIIGLQHRLLDVQAPVRAQRGLLHRSTFPEALTWLEIHGGRPDVLAHWRAVQMESVRQQPLHHSTETALPGPFQRRRRRRRRPRAPYVAPQE